MSSTDTGIAMPTDPEARVLVKFNWDCGRMGSVTGLFVTTVGTLTKSFGKAVYFGEILGKHSEVYGELSESDITVVTDDKDFIEKLVNLLGPTVSGYNPLSYLEDA